MPTFHAVLGNFTAPFSRGPLVSSHGGGFGVEERGGATLTSEELSALVASGEAMMLPYPLDMASSGCAGWHVASQMGLDLGSHLVNRGALKHRFPLPFGRFLLVVDEERAVGVRESLSNLCAWRSMIESARDSRGEALRWAEAAYALAPTMTPDLVALLSESLRAVGRVEDALALVQMEVNSKVL